MISSMTAFARTQIQGDFGSLTMEIRSINHRYLEVSLYLPDMLRVLEMPMRETIKKFVGRGKVECSIRFQPNPTGAGEPLKLNENLISALCKSAEHISGLLKSPSNISVVDILKFPGVLETKELDLKIIQSEVSGLLEKTLHELVEARKREGNELMKLFLQKMDHMQREVSVVKKRLPQVLIQQQERIVKRFADAKIELDVNRLEQEMVLFSQRIDVVEELERLETHIAELRRILKEGGAIGRRLDFLMQELNREANTLASKSVDTTVTHAALELKVLVEQVREQVQNIE